MLNCKQVTRLLSEAQDRELRLTEKVPLKLHLMLCAGCNNFHQQMDFLRQATRRYPPARSDTDEA